MTRSDRNKTGIWAGLLGGVSALVLAGCNYATADRADEEVSSPPAATVQTLATTPAANWPDLGNPSSSDDFTEEGLTALAAGLEKVVSEKRVYGLSSLLVKDGEVIHHTKAGVRRLADQAPITDDTIYRIYSMTKPITGVALMMLYEEGKFSLDDPITKFIPEFEDLKVLNGVSEDGTAITVDANRAPTMRELMSHTAGFAYGLQGTDPANQAFRDNEILRSPDFATLVSKVSDVPLLFQPGEDWFYSVAVDLQGYIIEKISGQSFGSFLDERIFTPLGMEDTGFYVPEADYDRFSEVYGYNPENGQLVPLPYPQVQFTKDTVPFESGGGGLVATLGDYARFCQMLVNGGTYNGTRLLKEETVELMRTNVLPESIKLFSDGTSDSDEELGIGFGLDFGVVTDPELAKRPYGKGSYFWGGAAGTWFWIDPENDLFFIGMVQIFNQGGPQMDLRGDSAELVYAALKK